MKSHSHIILPSWQKTILSVAYMSFSFLLFVLHVEQIEIWENWRPIQHLEHFVLKPYWKPLHVSAAESDHCY